jgi:pyruvyltransferase
MDLNDLSKQGHRNITKILANIKGNLQNNKVSAYWWVGVPNFGDIITPLLLKYYNYTPVHSSIGNAQLVSTGSILNMLPEDYEGIILGSGFINDTCKRRFEKAKVLALRGKYTKKLLGIESDIALGDPGLLASDTVKHRQNKKYVLGIIPHYVDSDNIKIMNLKKKYPKEIIVIDVKEQPEKVLEIIDSCNYIISSSLHGIIVADSFNIPTAWMSLSDKVVGNGFKFYDYNSAISANQMPVSITGLESLNSLIGLTIQKPKEEIIRSKELLGNLFKNVSSYI